MPRPCEVLCSLALIAFFSASARGAEAPASYSDAQMKEKAAAAAAALEGVDAKPFTKAFASAVAPQIAALADALGRAADPKGAGAFAVRQSLIGLKLDAGDDADLTRLVAEGIAQAPDRDSNFIAINTAFQIGHRRGDADMLDRLAKQADDLGATAEAVDMIRQTAALERMLVIGKPFPAFALSDLDGKARAPASYAGKVLLIDFWATWCPNCRREMPELIATYAELHPKGLEILGVSLDTDKAKLQSYIAKNQVTWPQAFDGKGWNSAYPQSLQIHETPDTMLIGPEGALLGKHLEGDGLWQALRAAVARLGAAAPQH